jgi:hypothetical protein
MTPDKFIFYLNLYTAIVSTIAIIFAIINTISNRSVKNIKKQLSSTLNKITETHRISNDIIGFVRDIAGSINNNSQSRPPRQYDNRDRGGYRGNNYRGNVGGYTGNDPSYRSERPDYQAGGRDRNNGGGGYQGRRYDVDRAGRPYRRDGRDDDTNTSTTASSSFVPDFKGTRDLIKEAISSGLEPGKLDATSNLEGSQTDSKTDYDYNDIRRHIGGSGSPIIDGNGEHELP